ncbi:MAG: Radical domain protein [Chthoniobacteraceae bacterium]|nr:Radical domain protein [Chthoniobacteraceae bacterium]
MSEILLTTLNARYIHAAFGLRYLMANLGELQERAAIQEFDINQRPLEIVEAILQHSPRIVGFGVYIWNVTLTSEVIAVLKRLRPEIIIILGGPEVSHEIAGQPIVEMADHVITGEADIKFAEVCRALLCSEPGVSKPAKIIVSELPTLDSLAFPYSLYSDHDLAHRVLYVEASRGCPFTCEFCLSSLDVPVRAVPLEPFLEELGRLLERGARQFKFVDRTFNLNLNTSRAILEFFLAHWRDGLFVHFEMVPDRLPEQIREVIARFPAGALQFEVGIQTFDEATSRNISRRQNLVKLEDNIRYLREKTGVHIHADLIVGLPGEDMASFGRGFDRLVALGPQEIQVGILKRLRGTPIVRHDLEWGMVYGPQPPYEILRNKLLDFSSLQRMRRFARLWDLVANSGNFALTTPLIWTASENDESAPSPFVEFLRLTDWMVVRLGRLHSIARAALAENLFLFLTSERLLPREQVVEALERDWHGGVRREKLSFLEPAEEKKPASRAMPSQPKRQARHLV